MNEQLQEMGLEIEGKAWEAKEKSFYAKKLGSLGGKKRAKKYSKKQLKEWGKKGGRPKKPLP